MIIKQALYEQCQQYVQQRIDTARQAMEAAQEAANSESKSSAGDKYETGRAMAQLERDRNAQLLAEARKVEGDLKHVDTEKTFATVQVGSVVTTSRATFFISIGAGKLRLNGVDYFAVSPASPIAISLTGRKVGDVITVNNTAYEVLNVI